MLSDEKLIQLKKYLVKPGKKIDLKKFETRYTGAKLSKSEAEALLESGRKHLAEMQDILYAHNKFGILIIFQAMDAAGKDGAVKHIMSGFNPLGVKVYSFKAPTANELDHDFFWRHTLALPGRGEIAIHNRSHYENVLVTRVHPEYILKENLPDIHSLDAINKTFWNNRYKQIRRYEKNLSDNGVVILKFFLHLSRKEQKKRFLERIDDPAKNWKFSSADISERDCWEAYQKAYEDALQNTSREHAPWYIIPADNKWFTRLAIAAIIYRRFQTLDLHYPAISGRQKEELVKARQMLMEEKEDNGKKGSRKRQKGSA